MLEFAGAVGHGGGVAGALRMSGTDTRMGAAGDKVATTGRPEGVPTRQGGEAGTGPPDVSVVVLPHELPRGGRLKSSVDLTCALASVGHDVECVPHPRVGVPDHSWRELAEAGAELRLLRQPSARERACRDCSLPALGRRYHEPTQELPSRRHVQSSRGGGPSGVAGSHPASVGAMGPAVGPEMVRSPNPVGWQGSPSRLRIVPARPPFTRSWVGHHSHSTRASSLPRDHSAFSTLWARSSSGIVGNVRRVSGRSLSYRRPSCAP